MKRSFRGYRVSNWSESDHAHMQRGELTLSISTDAATTWKPASSGRPATEIAVDIFHRHRYEEIV